MKNLSDGLLVLYDAKVDFRDALDIAAKLFESLGIKPNDMGYQRPGRDGSGYSEVKSVKKLSDFESLIEEPGLQHIVIASRERGNPAAYLTFYYGHDEIHPDFYRLIVAYKGKKLVDFDLEGLVPLVQGVNGRGTIPYGFSCHIDLDEVTQYEYADAQTLFVPFLPYEDPDRWKVEVPTYLAGHVSPRRYLSGMLRLVYEWNFLNSAHLAMSIGDGSLGGWIEDDSTRGVLSQIDNGLWSWHVDPSRLVEINEACGRAGLLVAWKAPAPSARPGARLP